MIARLIAAVKVAQNRPAGMLELLVGGAAIGLGLALVDRVRRTQLAAVAAAGEELGELASSITVARARLDALRAEEAGRVDQVLEGRDA